MYTHTHTHNMCTKNCSDKTWKKTNLCPWSWINRFQTAVRLAKVHFLGLWFIAFIFAKLILHALLIYCTQRWLSLKKSFLRKIFDFIIGMRFHFTFTVTGVVLFSFPIECLSNKEGFIVWKTECSCFCWCYKS